ncbi:hypothetical protein NSND_50137 [Nitrospira sp. ND1]|uniref:helix-turn-helix domain-containing protein n=1 Tax=Nitrospira sp. ND1 TaxID=1658518 RepID=UPI0009B962DB|nr:helix-turn-helix domain-containing protein [Nitrospira sp. ND1]SLM41751.1 hypothetical protein NSND_50137 [Nitrospira sp. ND1]
MLLTAKELAHELDVHISTVRRAYRTGRIPYERLCKMYLFDLEKVRDAMRRNGFTLAGTDDGLRATGGESRRRAQPTSPRLGKTGASIARTPRRKK